MRVTRSRVNAPFHASSRPLPDSTYADGQERVSPRAGYDLVPQPSGLGTKGHSVGLPLSALLVNAV